MDVSSGSGLAKLLPRSLSVKRRRRKNKLARTATLDGEANGPRWNGLDSDDARSMMTAGYDEELDRRSFRSYGSGSALRESYTAAAYAARPVSSPPAAPRPATISAHPTRTAYLSTSSPPPVVQAEHLNAQSYFEAQYRHTPSPSHRHDGRSSLLAASPESQDGFVIEPPAAARVPTSTDEHSRQPPRIVTHPPRTPPPADRPAPVIVNTPPTPTDRQDVVAASTPDSRVAGTRASPGSGADGSSVSSLSALHSMTARRRSKSGSISLVPSKLSSITSAPLTPTDETAETSLPAASSSTGFFSSVLSAAQNAATTISNNIPTPSISLGGNKSRSSLAKPQPSPVHPPDGAEPEPEPEPRISGSMDHKESAVRTLGSGDLCLSQFGIAETSGSVTSPASAKFPDVVDSRTRSESAPVDPQTRVAEAAPEEAASRPRSLVDVAVASPPLQPDPTEGKSSAPMQRSSSIRSAIRTRRKRGSSVTTGGTGTTVGAPAGAAPSSVISPSASFGVPKLTGFAIASKKRNRDFHRLFKSVPDDDYLIEDYSCALQREILAHGRLYVSEGHLCFSSNILGWTTMLVVSFDEIVSVEKRSTALLFKNGLMISTLHAKHIFASFTSRDATYDLIINIWKLGHPTLRSTLNGVRLEGTGGDKTEKIDAEPAGQDNETQEVASESDDGSDEGEDDDFYDEEENDVPATQATDVSGLEPEPERPGLRKVSSRTVVNGVSSEAPRETSSPTSPSADFPGPASHAPTECADAAAHYDKVVGDDVVPAPLGKVYDLVFGPASVAWMSKWLTGDQKCTELQMDDKKGLGPDNKTRTYSYIKPLTASIGPRQTKCIVAETLDVFDLDKAVSLSISTQNPDVPSGNVFSVKTKYCLSWAENNATRVQVNCTTEWTGKSWLKGPIEKGVVDGQTQYCKELFAALKSGASTRPRAGTGPNGSTRAKKKPKKSKALQSAEGNDESARSKHAAKQGWGPLEPVRGLLEPLVDLVRPVLTGNVMYGLLVGLLVAMWFGFGSGPRKGAGPDIGFYSADRLAAYEEMWRRQDSELWDWLEERVGLERLSSDMPNGRRRAMEPRTAEERLREERMNAREMEEAIRVTEEKLRVLREVVGKANEAQGSR
ncbi:hypothetical protein RJ55_08071 [Drechmeria coniospora]|nr:hypothetical protein RJ55_08071 [Drechmeria coniospora]